MITYSSKRIITASEFKDVLIRSTLGERRPVQNDSLMKAMVENSNLLVSAWDGEKLVGISRCVTDFCYCCYLSDLAVDAAYQKKGIGHKLIIETVSVLEPSCRVILLSAPAAVDYYPQKGFKQHPSAWTLPAQKIIQTKLIDPTPES